MRYTVLAAFLGLAAAATPAMAQQRPLFSIGAIADAQYADEDSNGARLYRLTPKKLAEAVADYNRQKLEFVVQLGDFIDKDWASYDVLLPIARKLKHPWHFVLGNHDFSVDEAHKAEVPARLGMPARYYAFETHGWMFLVTDGDDLSTFGWPEGSPQLKLSLAARATLYPDKPKWNGGIGAVQYRWIDAKLAEADKRGLKVMLFNHFPLFPESLEVNLWNAPDIMALLERHPSAKIWLDGHNHDGNYAQRAGIHYVNLKAMLDTEQTAYSRLDFFKDRVEVRGTGKQQDMVLKLR
ncbi:metallophosphoesterase [Sphingomonas sp.]|uniref:metallophosphoesterase n=1 Tax=Sphingomonas sp. TaxID=28214 RepID=UPI001B168019|nr:metallophosphoesterase [Sphingomonas sp.]MBO9712303.1 metallophosphoesterase [Sphingomonas sp.]